MSTIRDLLPQAAPRPRSLSEQTAAQLRSLIHQGTFKSGDQLPTELELARDFRVSRDTVRSAITELVTELLVEKRRGVGTFVRDGAAVPSHGLERLVGITEAIRSLGMTPSVVELSVERVTSGPDLLEAYRLPPGTSLARIERTWLADGERVLHGIDWVPTAVLPRPDALDDFTASESLSERLAGHGTPIDAAMSWMLPVLAGERFGGHLGLGPADPALLLRQIHYDPGPTSRPVLYADQYWRGDVIALHMVRRATSRRP